MLGKVYIVLAIVTVGEGDGTVGNDEAGGGKTHPNPSLYGGAYVIGGSGGGKTHPNPSALLPYGSSVALDSASLMRHKMTFSHFSKDLIRPLSQGENLLARRKL